MQKANLKNWVVMLVFLLTVISVPSSGRADSIEVINHSFEWADEVNLVTCHHSNMDGVLGWSGGAEPDACSTWSGVDVNCGWELACVTCQDWLVFPDGNTHCWMDAGNNVYQLTDHNITAGYKYILTFDSMTWWWPPGCGHMQPIRASFYYVDDVCAPHVNHNELVQEVHIVTGYEMASCPGQPDCLNDWEYDLTATFVGEKGATYIGEKLGIKVGSPLASDYPGSSWGWVDDIRLDWEWASSAYDPSPGDKETTVSKNPTLCWTPGLWTATTLGHQVYFGTDEAAVTDANTNSPEYIGAQGGNCYTPTGPLELGKTYHWRVDEVNDSYGGTEPPPGPWKGQVWSFEVEGHAESPSPCDGAIDVSGEVAISWTAGAYAATHEVYLGESFAEVNEANNSDTTGIYRTSLPVGTTTYDPCEDLMIGKTYYWRIDEVGNVTVKGRIWSFAIQCISGTITGDFTDDCVVDNWDLDIMATDWLVSDGCVPTVQQDAVLTMLDACEPNWVTGQINGALEFGLNLKVDVNDPRLVRSTALSITAWVKRYGDQDGYVGIVTSREPEAGGPPVPATELFGGHHGESVGYTWNEVAATWQFSSGLVVPDQTWTFIAMSVDPSGATLYAQPAGGALDSNRHTIDLEPLEQFADSFWIGRHRQDNYFWVGAIDDVRIYNYALDVNEITYLATEGVDGTEPDPNCPVYHYKFDDGSGLVAVDSGCGGTTYGPVLSPANLTDPEPKDNRFVNFRDYEIMANNWMKEFPWP